MTKQEFDESGRVIISDELFEAIRKKLQELEEKANGCYAVCQWVSIDEDDMEIDQENDIINYTMTIEEENHSETFRGCEAVLSKILDEINLKLFCPELKATEEDKKKHGICPHFVRDPKTFDPKLDSCDACLVFDSY